MRALKEMQSVGLIKKSGFGVWETIPQDKVKKRVPITPPKRCQSSHHVGQHHTPTLAPNIEPGMIRGHGIVATIKIPRFPNWNKDDRAKNLKKKKIDYIPIPQGHRIKVGWVDKVWLTDKPSIVIYFPKGTSWFGKDIETVAVGALQDTLKILTRIERMMGIQTLKIRGSYWLKFSRQHHSLIFNSLAKRYKDQGGQIYFKNEVGLWGLIDYSPADGVKLDEFETVRGEKNFKPYDPFKPLEEQIRPDNAARDDLIKNKAWFDGVQRTGITPEFILNTFEQTSNQIRESHEQMLNFSKTVSYLDKNMLSHVGAINNLSSQAQENAKTTVSLREAVERLATTMQEGTMPITPKPKLAESQPKQPKPLSQPLDLRLVEKACELCGEIHMIPSNEKNCTECKKLIAKYKKDTSRSAWEYSKPLLKYTEKKDS